MKKTYLLFISILFCNLTQAQFFFKTGSSATTGNIASLVVDANTNVLYAGGIANGDGSPLTGIGQWDGSNWSALGSGVTGPGNYVKDVAMYNGDLYAVGILSMVGGVSVAAIARWDGTSWYDVSGGATGYLNQAEAYNGKLYVGGNTSTVNGIPVNGVGCWDGTVWSDPGFPSDNDDPEVMEVADGKLWVGSQYDGIWSYDGTTWDSTYYVASNEINSIGFYNDTVIAGVMDNQGIGKLIKYNGSTWETFIDLFEGSSNNRINDLRTIGDTLYIMGDFETIGGVAVSDGIVKYCNGTFTDVGLGITDKIQVSAIYDGKLFMGSENPGWDPSDWHQTGSVFFTNADLSSGPSPTAPVAPSNLMVTVLASPSTTIQLDWTDLSSNESGFIIERSLDSTAWNTIDSVGMDVVTYADNNTTVSTLYYYRVSAYNGVGNSAAIGANGVMSNGPVATAPAAPSNLMVAVLHAPITTIQLDWTDNSNNEDGFIVERSLDSTAWNTIDTTAVDVIGLMDTDVIANTLYYYRVSAYNGVGNSATASAAGVNSGSTTTTGIETHTALIFEYFPNPTKGVIHFQLENKAMLVLYNTNGQVVKTTMGIAGWNNMDLSQLNKGTYFVVVNDGASQKTAPLIVE